MELREGAVIADRFRLIRQLGKGGMGEVWAAQHTSLDIPCAVKFIHAESAQKPEVRARFEREAKAAAQLRTNNVVQILDYGIFENTPYIAMEYLEGEPLNARLKRKNRLDPHETFAVVRDIARALTKAHAAGVVHRDLKPENVFLVMDDDREIAKVLDFGVAKSADKLDSNTQTGALLGTPYYMSPEQAQGTKSVDHRADLWSLAVLTFRCLTGELPFKSTALGDLLIKIVTHPLTVPSHVAAGLPDGFDAWWQRAAQRDPDQRFQSAKELTQALAMALNVSMPSTLGNTPMPGGSVGAEIKGARQLISQTMVADPSELPGGGATPFHAPAPHQDPAMQPFGTGPYPQPGYAGHSSSQSGHSPSQPGYGAPHHGAGATHPGHPARHPSHASLPNPAQIHAQIQAQGLNPVLGDSHGNASVAGVPIAARPTSSSGGKVALLTIVALIALVGGVGGFLLLRAPAAATNASDGDTATVPASSGDALPGGDGAEPPTTSEVDDAASADPPASPSADPSTETSASAKPSAAPRVVTRPVPVPRAVPVPVPVPVPAPPPPPPPVPRPPKDSAGF